MKTISISQFGNGLAESQRSKMPYVAEDMGNIDILSDENRLKPYRDTAIDTESVAGQTITDIKITDCVKVQISGITNIVGLGRESASSEKIRILTRQYPTFPWSSASVSTTYDTKSNSLFVYNGKAYCITATNQLLRFDPPSTLTFIAALSGATYTGEAPRPFVHPADNRVYMGVGNVLYVYDIASPSTISTVVTLPTDAVITSVTSYGDNVAFSVKYEGQSRDSSLLIHNKVIGETRYVDSKDIDGRIRVVENLGGILVIVKDNYTDTNTSITPKISLMAYAGGEVTMIRENVWSSYALINKQKINNRVYFSVQNTDAIFSISKNKNGNIIISKECFINNGASVSTLNGFSVVDDYFFFSLPDNSLVATVTTDTKTNSSYYITPINYAVPQEDKTLNKRIKAVSCLFSPLTSGQSVKIEVRTNGGTWREITTQSTVGATIIRATNLATGEPLDEAIDIEFKITFVGAIIYDFKYAYDAVKDTLI